MRTTETMLLEEVNEGKSEERKLDPCGGEAKSETSSMDSGSVCVHGHYRAVLPGDVT